MNIRTVINARVTSSRLKEKMLLPLGDATFIEQVWRLAKLNSPVEIIAATSDEAADTRIVELAKRNDVPIVRGHATDILARYATVASQYDVDGFIVWEGDCLFVDRECTNKTRQLLLEGYDFVEPKDLPLGTFCYGLSVAALTKILSIKDDRQTEGWGRYLKQIPGFKNTTYEINAYAPIKDLRLTLDYPEDYELIKKVFAFIQAQGSEREMLKGIAAFAKQYPQECQINQGRIKEYWDRFKRKYSTIHLKK